MNELHPTLYPEFQELYEAASDLAVQLTMQGHTTYEIGPLCSRDHAYQLHELKEAVKAFMKALPPNPNSLPEYRRTQQAVFSILNSKP